MKQTEKKNFWSRVKTFFNSKKTLSAIAGISVGVLITGAIAGGGFLTL